jgi:hypothetical protein
MWERSFTSVQEDKKVQGTKKKGVQDDKKGGVQDNKRGPLG